MYFLTPEDVNNEPFLGQWVFDIEIFKNFFFFGAKQIGQDRYFVAWADESTPLDKETLLTFIGRHTLIGFNSYNFDIPILAAALHLPTIEGVKAVCDSIIIDKVRRYTFEQQFDIPIPKVDEIDIMEVCPLKGGLKMYGARLHAKKIQEVPIHVENFLSGEEKQAVGDYCLNDLALTELLAEALSEQIELRRDLGKRYEIDLRSRSDAQIAERIMEAEIKTISGRKIQKPLIPVGTEYRYNAPAWMGFQTPALQELFSDVLAASFQVGQKGACTLPKALEGRTVTIGKGVYRIGIGGLHSSEKGQTIRSDEKMMLVDRDVASYYPATILNQGLYPQHIGETFLDVYKDIVDRRLLAKRAGNKVEADSLKIVVNGTYGKFGSRFSSVYSPDLIIQVTLTGQLALLMLIEYAEIQGFKVVSANTDGLVFYIERERKDELDAFLKGWEDHTGYDTEETLYEALYSRDVNNYIAVKEGGGVKTKGTYQLPEGIFRFHKNPDCNIVTRAVIAYLTEGTPLAKTIDDCEDIREFLVVRKVEGGAVWAGQKVGSVIRWYFSRHCSQAIEYGSGDKKGDKVPNSEGARVVLELPDKFPNDIDTGYYLDAAEKALKLLGAVIEETDEQYLLSLEELERFR